MVTVYRIRDWDEHFENNRSREIANTRWVPVPNKLDSHGYIELTMTEEDEDPVAGAARFGAWMTMVQVASRCERRGTLTRNNGKPHTARTLAVHTRLPEAVFKDTIAKCLELQWLEAVDDSDVSGVTAPNTPPPPEAAGGCQPERQPSDALQKEGRNRKKEENTPPSPLGS